MVTVSTTKSDPPTPRSRTLAHAAQRREQERVERRRERNAQRRERREQRSEEFRLCEQQGLSLPGTEEYSSSDEEEEEEEEEDRGQVLRDRWEPAPRHWSRLRWQEDHRLGRAQRCQPPGNLRQRRHEPRRRQRTPQRRPRARRRRLCAQRSPRARGSPRAVECGWRRGGGYAGRAHDVGGDLEEEEVGLLLLEVRSCLSRGHVPDGRGSDDSLPCPQGGANCALPPRAGQGAKGGRIRSY
jgi:hypothetical protein